jgi:hypothetical protein
MVLAVDGDEYPKRALGSGRCHDLNPPVNRLRTGIVVVLGRRVQRGEYKGRPASTRVTRARGRQDGVPDWTQNW